MEISRRFFLGGAIAAAAVAVSPIPAFAVYPTLYADGIHDDSDALDAMLARQPYVVDGVLVAPEPGSVVDIKGLTLRISRPLCIRGDGPVIIMGCHFHSDFTGLGAAIQS